METLGISQLDFVFVTGDAYADHPSFAAALLGRVLGAEGFSNEQFTQEFFRFILPALSPAQDPHAMDVKDFAAYGFSFTEPLAPAKKKQKRS